MSQINWKIYIYIYNVVITLEPCISRIQYKYNAYSYWEDGRSLKRNMSTRHPAEVNKNQAATKELPVYHQAVVCLPICSALPFVIILFILILIIKRVKRLSNLITCT